jgi:histidinol-phosphate aminotransferase
VGHEELRAFLAQVPPHVLVVIDEAYVHFQNDPVAARGLELYREFPNVAVLHTFSKAYGLAALRLGYTVARPEVMEGLAKVALPFGVTDIAQAAGVASLLAEPELQARIDVLLEERAKLEAYLATTDWDAPASQANFVWLAAGEETDALQAHLMSRGIIGRAFSGTGIRISVGSPEANEALVDALGSYIRG